VEYKIYLFLLSANIHFLPVKYTYKYKFYWHFYVKLSGGLYIKLVKPPYMLSTLSLKHKQSIIILIIKIKKLLNH